MRKPTLSSTAILALLAGTLLLIASHSVTAMGSGESPGLPRIRENQTIRLPGGTYRGGSAIDADGVTLTGAGLSQTIIDGDLTINGDRCTLQLMTIQGDLFINGERAELQGVRVRGKINSLGWNNRQ